jgi:hypothetical protein
MEEHRLRTLRRIFGPKAKAVSGGWRRLRNEQLHNLYASPNAIRVIKSRLMRWVWHVDCMGEVRNAYTVFVGKSEGRTTWKN